MELKRKSLCTLYTNHVGNAPRQYNTAQVSFDNHKHYLPLLSLYTRRFWHTLGILSFFWIFQIEKNLIIPLNPEVE